MFTCQNATLLEITCRGSHHNLEISADDPLKHKMYNSILICNNRFDKIHQNEKGQSLCVNTGENVTYCMLKAIL